MFRHLIVAMAQRRRDSSPVKQQSSQISERSDKESDKEPQQPQESSNSRRCCSKNALALIPIAIALLLYHVPTIVEEYEARYG